MDLAHKIDIKLTINIDTKLMINYDAQQNYLSTNKFAKLMKIFVDNIDELLHAHMHVHYNIHKNAVAE